MFLWGKKKNIEEINKSFPMASWLLSYWQDKQKHCNTRPSALLGNPLHQEQLFAGVPHGLLPGKMMCVSTADHTNPSSRVRPALTMSKSMKRRSIFNTSSISKEHGSYGILTLNVGMSEGSCWKQLLDKKKTVNMVKKQRIIGKWAAHMTKINHWVTFSSNGKLGPHQS